MAPNRLHALQVIRRLLMTPLMCVSENEACRITPGVTACSEHSNMAGPDLSNVFTGPAVRGAIMSVWDISEIGVQEMRLSVTAIMHSLQPT